MFMWLHRILLMTVVVIAIFFVVSSMTFSGRLAEGELLHSPVAVHVLTLFHPQITDRSPGGLNGGCWMVG